MAEYTIQTTAHRQIRALVAADPDSPEHQARWVCPQRLSTSVVVRLLLPCSQEGPSDGGQEGGPQERPRELPVDHSGDEQEATTDQHDD